MQTAVVDAIRRRAIVRGQVQGVFYRDSCCSEAERLGVHGWVRNCADGTVEVLIEGEPGAVGRLVDWCRLGPPWAEVTAVEVLDEQPEGLLGFRVVR